MNRTLAGASKAINTLDGSLKQHLANPYVLGAVTLILILYGSFAQQTLPTFMYHLFDNRLFSFIIFLFIAFLGTQDFKVAFVVALLYAILMHNFSQKKINEAFMSGLRTEGFIDYNGQVKELN